MTKIIAVMSPKGGVGKTSFTSEFGIALSKLKQKTLLIDSNLYAANLSLYLGMKNHPATLNDVLKSNMDVSKAIYHYSENLFVLPSSIHIESEENLFEANKFRKILISLHAKYDYIVIDTEPSMGKINNTIVKHVDEVVVVSTPDLPALLTSHKLVILLKQDDVKCSLVLNKVSHRGYELKMREIEELMGIPVLKEIPYDVSVVRAVAKRKPLMKGRIFKKIQRIAEQIVEY
ncbi:MAG: AAA family ATPase [Nitrospiraceae bacterium]|nr:AAA family ATPase [Nitrospiraceae bacterium]